MMSWVNGLLDGVRREELRRTTRAKGERESLYCGRRISLMNRAFPRTDPGPKRKAAFVLGLLVLRAA